MKMPWVSRELYERAERECETWKAEYRALQYSIANPPQPVVETLAVIEPATPKEKDPISQRIEDVSEGDRKLVRHFRALERKMRKDGASDGDILAAIKWTSTEDGQ